MAIDKEKLKKFIVEGWTSYVLIGMGLFFLLFLTASFAVWRTEANAKVLTQEFNLEAKNLECKIVADVGKRAFINEQRNEIVAYTNSHLRTAISFYGYFYATYAIFSIFGLIAAISLAVITKKGIEAASNHVIAVFLVSTGIVILYQGFFGVFQQKSNIDNNTKLSVGYSKLVNQIDTYCTTGKVNVKDPLPVFADALPKAVSRSTPANTNTASGNTNTALTETPAPPTDVKVSPFYVVLEPDAFINYIDWQMEQYKAIAIAIDDTKIAAIDKSKMVLP